MKLRLFIGGTGLALDQASDPIEEPVQALLFWKGALTLLENTPSVAPHQHHARSSLPHSVDALHRTYPHDPLTHADGSKSEIVSGASGEDDDTLTDVEGRLALDPHRKVAEMPAERFDDDFGLLGRVPANVALDEDSVRGAESAVRVFETLRKHDSSQQDLVRSVDELLELCLLYTSDAADDRT